jgi:hypothetical protein
VVNVYNFLLTETLYRTNILKKTILIYLTVGVLFCFSIKLVDAQSRLFRIKQLDSLVTNLDKSIIRNLDSVHFHIHQFGRNDFERIFMFYGLIAIHYEYDQERFKQRSRTPYTHYYTAYNRSGVCNDFARLFKELCDRSNIPCVVATGKVKLTAIETIFQLFVSKKINRRHAWNIVRYNREWHLMDPTWANVSYTEKLYANDSNGKRNNVGKIEVVNRYYFNISSEQLYAKRKAFHPAFYLDSTVYTYKTAWKKSKKKEELFNKYDYDGILSELGTHSYYDLLPKYNAELKYYFKGSKIPNSLYYLTSFIKSKRTRYNPITIEACDAHFEKLKAVQVYLNSNSGGNINNSNHNIEVENIKKELIRKKNKKLEIK